MTIATAQELELTFYLDGRLRLIGKDLHSGSPTQEQEDTLLERAVALTDENFAGYDYDSYTFCFAQETENAFSYALECYEDGDEDPTDGTEGILTL